MDRPEPSGSLTLADFLDVALLGSIVLAIGVSLMSPMEVDSSGATSGSADRVLVDILLTLGSVSGPAQTVGLVLTLAGGVMILIGPLWILVGRPMARRGYL